eukprot:754913-Lingulodinium_polyedra.AAC.1
MDTWAAAMAEAIPGSGDGIALLCRHLAQRSESDEPSVAIAAGVNGSMVQRILEQLRPSRASCHLL